MNESGASRGRSALVRIRDFVLYVLIGLAVVAATILYAVYVPPSKRIDFRWGRLFIMTLVTFGYLLKWYRRCWLTTRFWCIYSGLLAVHVIVFTAVLTKIDLGGFWLAALGPIEWAVMFRILEWVGQRPAAGPAAARH